MYHQLTEPERYSLSVLKREGRSLRSIAKLLQRSPSTISRKVRRNATIDHRKPRPLYVPSKAQEQANGRRRRSRRVRHHAPHVYAYVEALLVEQQWSPEQIASQLPAHLDVQLSAMTIYRHIHRDQRQGGGLKRHLRQGGKRRRKRTFGTEKRGKLANKPMIDTRPEAVEDRQQVGHWEGDTVMGATGERTCLLTLVERSTGWAEVVRLPHRTVHAVNRAALDVLSRSGLPFQTITWDNGTGFHGYRALEDALPPACAVTSLIPTGLGSGAATRTSTGYSARTSPKRKSLARIRQADCNAIATKLNHRPRKRHDYQTPAQRLQALSGVLHLDC